MEPRWTAEQVTGYLDRVMPQRRETGPRLDVEAISVNGARLRLVFEERLIRPGGSIAGPAMFALADFALYVAVLGMLGPVEMAVTTNLNINFLRRPARVDLLGEARLFKLGRRLASGEVAIYSDGEPDMVAHAVGTYSIPPTQS